MIRRALRQARWSRCRLTLMVERQPVEGELLAATIERITLKRSDAEAGTVHVHFPRMGYRMTAAQ